MSEPFMHIWTVYCRPADMPDHFVARRHDVHRGESKPSQTFMAAPTLRELHQILPMGLHRIPRDPDDDPKIVESWL